MDYSQFQLVYSYNNPPCGDEKYYKLIKHLGSQWKLSLYCRHYIYYYQGNYYVFAKRPLSDEKRTRKPSHIISEEEADEIMAR